ncbi:hypothetical protein HN51_033725 [Arachis hypogaea]|uniref:Uncharacterized protein n=1 Tax=Arachis hypogaea TaxID=3818 RepID=A0A445AAL5_ARAHY|nr:uncharacterized protein LOC107629388 [Arachis ipaensis]XP_025641470.1 uncharacterized protein LOC112736298 [Arachis hypogaea]RYR23503.1 hypothetical protein Ahy_B03g068714 [Arachis hypogaea]
MLVHRERESLEGGGDGVSFGEGGIMDSLEMLPLDFPLLDDDFMSSFIAREIGNVNWEALLNEEAARLRGSEATNKEEGGDFVFDFDDDDDDALSEEFSVFNYTDEDDDSQSLIRCRICDLELDFPTPHCNSETFDPANMVCPVCDEKLGETAARKFISLKKSKSRKSIVSSGESSMRDKKLAARASQHEPTHGSFFSSCAQNRSSSHRRVDSISNASDISSTESSVIGSPALTPAMTDDEENVEERRLRASFAQKLVLSTMI